jgi:hypothetical protein
MNRSRGNLLEIKVVFDYLNSIHVDPVAVP